MPGLVTLVESLHKSEQPPLLDHAQRLPSGVACVALSPSATAAGAQLRSAGPYLGPYLSQVGHPVLFDVGMVVPDARAVPALSAADLLLWFVRPTREELLVLRHRLAECSQPEDVAVVLVGDTPYNESQVADGLGVEVLHTLSIDSRGAAAVNLGGDDRYLRRRVLARSCAELATRIAARATSTSSSAALRSAGSLNTQVDLRQEPLAPPHSSPDELRVWTSDSHPTNHRPNDPPVVVWVNDEN
ncbi:MAG: hypothetical protein HOK58_02070 [Acidimicrobiaceae bacterium]|nr:hypothetical protein [Acidimicrobiaceae bacterium]